MTVAGLSLLQEAAGADALSVAGIDLSSLRLAVLCAELGSLSKAAKRANMSLSCASHRLSALEELLRSRLFVRDYQGLTVTAAGAILAIHARAMLGTFNALRGRLDALPAHNGAQH